MYVCDTIFVKCLPRQKCSFLFKILYACIWECTHRVNSGKNKMDATACFALYTIHFVCMHAEKMGGAMHAFLFLSFLYTCTCSCMHTYMQSWPTGWYTVEIFFSFLSFAQRVARRRVARYLHVIVDVLFFHFIHIQNIYKLYKFARRSLLWKSHFKERRKLGKQIFHRHFNAVYRRVEYACSH